MKRLVELPVVRKRGTFGFTLIELLVVVAIIVLLLAILVPSFKDVLGRARAATCRNNLHQISTALATHKADQQDKRLGQRSDYPRAEQWPGVPYNVCPTPGIFICPEAEGFAAAAPLDSVLSRLCYVNIDSSPWKPPRNIRIPFDDPAHQGLDHMHMGNRTGSDWMGDYIEIGLDDNSVVTANYMDYDGHDGLIRIYEDVGGRTIARLMKYSCSEYDCVHFDGEPLFVSPDDPAGVTDPDSEQYGWMGPGTSKNGMEVELTGMSCTYGMTLGSERLSYGSNKFLVLDYDDEIVDPSASDVQSMLQAAARHLDKINILFADGTVRPFGPTEIDPQLNAQFWP